MFLFPAITNGDQMATDSPVEIQQADSITTKQNKNKNKIDNKNVADIVKNYFNDKPILARIAWCESRFRHVDRDGNIFRGIENNEDIGVMQINEHYHKGISERLGFDIYTLRGNMAYARYLYDKEGSAPWSSSSECWKKSNSNKELAINEK